MTSALGPWGVAEGLPPGREVSAKRRGDHRGGVRRGGVSRRVRAARGPESPPPPLAPRPPDAEGRASESSAEGVGVSHREVIYDERDDTER
jgi:hypothetical protein